MMCLCDFGMSVREIIDPFHYWHAAVSVLSYNLHTWSAVGHSWSAVGHSWSAVGHTWSAVGHPWSAVGQDRHESAADIE